MEAATARPGASARLLESLVAEAVIGGAFLVVFKDSVGLAQFLELLFGIGVIRVAVRMILHGHLAVGFFQHIGAGVPFDPERLVIVVFRHHRAPLRRETMKTGPNYLLG